MQKVFLNIFNRENKSILEMPLCDIGEPEITEFHLFSYAGMEIFLYNLEKKFGYQDLQTFENIHSSIFFTHSGIKMILVYKNISKSAIKRIFLKIHSEIKEMAFNPVRYGFVNHHLYGLGHENIQLVALEAFKDEEEE